MHTTVITNTRLSAFDVWAFAILGFIGLFIPTSSQGEILQFRTALVTLLMVVSVGLIGLRARLISTRRAVLGGVIAALLLLFSVFWAEYKLAWGALVPYAYLATVIALRVPPAASVGPIRVFWTIASLIILGLALGIVFEIELIRLFIFSYYAAFYDDLLTIMLDWGNKPVTVFGTHSLAGMFYLIFFAINVHLGRTLSNPWHYVLALCFFVMTYLLKSNTAILALIVMVWIAATCAVRARHGLTIEMFVPLAAIASIVVVFANLDESGYLDVLLDPHNGLIGRYGGQGVLWSNLAVMFKPVGLADLEGRLFYGDSGYVEYMTRGSLPLMVTIYGGFYQYMRANVSDTKRAVLAIILVMLFELGFTVLTYFRFLAILPLITLALNVATGSTSRTACSSHGRPRRVAGSGATEGARTQ